MARRSKHKIGEHYTRRFVANFRDVTRLRVPVMHFSRISPGIRAMTNRLHCDPELRDPA